MSARPGTGNSRAARILLLDLALAAATFAAGAGVAELLSRRAAAARAARADEREARLVVRHPLLGWAKRPGADAWLARPEYRVHLEVNAQGLRGPLATGPPPPAGRVLLLGDSFTEGYTVDEADTVRARLQELLAADGRPAQVVNGGTHGYSTDQEYLFYREEGVHYGARDVVLLFYYNDLFGNASAENGKPVFTLDGGRLVLHPPESRPAGERADAAYRPAHLEPWHHSMALRLLSDRTARSNPRLHDALARAGLAEPVSHAAPAEMWPFGPEHPDAVADMWRRTRALLAALDGEAAAQGARLLVAYVPARFEIYDASWDTTRERWGMGPLWRREAVEEQLAAACATLHLQLLDLRAPLRSSMAGQRLYFHADDHWTADGNAVAAAAIARALHPAGAAGG